jgi:hypothetical protein
MLCMPIFDHELGAKKYCPLFVRFVSVALNLYIYLDPKTYHWTFGHARGMATLRRLRLAACALLVMYSIIVSPPW